MLVLWREERKERLHLTSGSLGSHGGEGTQSQQPCVEEDYGADGDQPKGEEIEKVIVTSTEEGGQCRNRKKGEAS